MMDKLPRLLLGLAVASMSFSGCAQMPQSKNTAVVDYEGLAPVTSRRLDAAFIRPGVDFNVYKRLRPGNLELAYRTPNRSQQQFALTAEQKTRFRQLLIDAFKAEFTSKGTLEVVDAPGPDVLTLNVRVQDIVARIPPSGGGPGRAAILLDALGEATLVLEVRDSQSNEILARGVDTRATEGAAILQKSGPMTKWSEADALCQHWAKAARRALDSLTQG